MTIRPERLPYRSGVGAGARSIAFAGTGAETTLAGAHVAGATSLALASAAGFRTDFTLQIGVEGHTIEAVDEGASQVEIAAPGLGAAYQGPDVAVSAWPLFGADRALALPAVEDGHYRELDVRCLFDLPLADGNPPVYSGVCVGAYVVGSASWAKSHTNFGYWQSGGNVGGGLASYLVALVHGTAGAADAWSLDYEIATNRLIFVPFTAAAVSSIPRIREMTVFARL